MRYVYDVRIDPNVFRDDENLRTGLFATKRGATKFVVSEFKKLGVSIRSLPESGTRIRHVPPGGSARLISVRWTVLKVRP